MDFKEFKTALQQHVAIMLENADRLFVVEVDKDKLWERYLESFPAGKNDIFRKRREHDCSSCRHFIRAFGNVIKIKDGVVTTIWDVGLEDDAYKPVVEAMAALIRSRRVADVFITKESVFGIDKNHEQVDQKVLTWDHLFIRLPARLVDTSRDTDDSIRGSIRDVRNVFKRGLDEITEDAVLTVLELIAQKSLYKGEEQEGLLKEYLKLHRAYHQLDPSEDRAEGDGATTARGLFAWEVGTSIPESLAKIRGHAIGTLLVDVSLGLDLDAAVSKFEKMVAPENYKRPQAVFTKKMLEAAQKEIEDLGLMSSLPRRHARMDDVTLPNVLFADRDAAKVMGDTVFDEMAAGVAVDPRAFDRLDEVSVEDFIKDVIPVTTSIQALLENRHAPNLVSLIAPVNRDAPTLFKWGNGFSWAYSGNITDAMKERVKAAGGKVDGVLRFSIQWNDGAKHDPNDLDAHCVEPGRNRIYFADSRSYRTRGELDVDIQHPIEGTPAVENIIWPSIDLMPEGIYSFSVHNYAHRGGRDGFSAEIEFSGQIFSFSYDREVRQGEDVKVAKVSYSRRDGFKLIEELPSTSSSRSIWGLTTCQFHPVSMVMYSPNYWDAQEGIGNRHFLFMLKNCVNDEQPNGFFNEYLREDLMAHKRVFEALGAKMRVEPSADQLSGIGFSSTKHTSLVVKVEGRVSRALKINF